MLPDYVNIFTRDRFNTEPYNNSVLILPVALEGIDELTQDNPSFSFHAFTQRLQVPQIPDKTDWVRYDPTHPAIDTARAGVEGTPIYGPTDPVVVTLDRDVLQGAPPPAVMLLHHSNEPGMHMEIVELNDVAIAHPSDLSVQQDAPASLTAGATAGWTVTVNNQSGADAKGAVLELEVSGDAKLTALASDQGACDLATGKCGLAPLPVGAAATATLEVEAGQSSFDVKATVRNVAGCELVESDNHTTASIDVLGGAGGTGGTGGSGGSPSVGADGGLASLGDYTPGGGCTCRANGAPARGRAPGTLIALLGLLTVVIRRRVSR